MKIENKKLYYSSNSNRTMNVWIRCTFLFENQRLTQSISFKVNVYNNEEQIIYNIIDYKIDIPLICGKINFLSATMT